MITITHGLGQDSKSWNKVAKKLNFKDFEIPKISKMLQSGANFENIYSEFEKYCNNFNQKLDLCGLSLGGLLCLNYAIKNPSKVDSLILIGTPCNIPKNIFKFQTIIFKVLPKKAFSGFDMKKSQVLELLKSLENLNFENDLNKISAKTLIIYGKKDLANKNQIRFFQKIKNAHFLEIPKSGHEVNKHQPEILATEINNFLEEKL